MIWFSPKGFGITDVEWPSRRPARWTAPSMSVPSSRSSSEIRLWTTWSSTRARPTTFLALRPRRCLESSQPKKASFDEAIRSLEEAAIIQDGLHYSEPSPWHPPVRQVLGAVLLEAGRPAEAEAVSHKDLDWNRHNGWSLYGLLQAQRAQGKTTEAAETQEEFEDAWGRADVALPASRF